MEKKYIIILLILLIVISSLISFLYFYTYIVSLSPETESSSQQKIIEVTLNSDGTSSEKIIWKISLENSLLKFSPGEWGIYIPKKSRDISVKDPNGEIDYEIKETESEYYNFLLFKNPSDIYSNNDYFFDISYNVEKNPLILEPNYLYKRTFTRFETDSSFSLKIFLPKDAEIVSLSKIPVEQYFEKNKLVLNYNFEKNETVSIEINYKLDSTTNFQTINTKYYSAEIPERYAEEYQKILEKADNGVEMIEKIYGFSSPYKWKIEIINYNDPDFEPKTEGFYLGEGRIRLKFTHLQKTEEEILYIILHETVHGFNSKFFGDGVPNFWWEEGTAQYISYKVLESLGYDIVRLKEQDSNLLNSYKETDKKFIASWTPNVFLNSDEKTDYIALGYAYSSYIIETITSEYGEDIFKKFYSKAEKSKIEFSSEHSVLNNQINYVLSQAAGEDTTPLLDSFGLEITKAISN